MTQPEPCAWNNLLHVTRQDGEVVAVAKELVILGPMTVAMNGQVVGTTNELRMELPLWNKGDQRDWPARS